MPRKNLIRSSDHPYHVTARSHNQSWFPLPMPTLWDLCLENLEKAYQKHQVEIISFVLMSNHYHLMLKTPNANIDEFMYEFNKNLSLSIRQRTRQVNQVFGGRYKGCLIRSTKYFMNCYRYVYQNPLRAQITKKCEFYPYSSLFYLHQKIPFPIPLFDQVGFMDQQKLDWLNQNLSETEKSAIKKGLKKTELRFLKTSSNRKL